MSLRKVLLIAALAAAFSSPALTQNPPQALAKKDAPRSKAAKAANAPAVLWQDPGDIASRDLFHGNVQEAIEPKAPFTFVEEDMKGTSPKFVVHDGNGEKWVVKLGVEAKPETAASRLMWAVGYFANEDYYLNEMHVENMQRLKRQPELVQADGTVKGVRLKRSGALGKNEGDWSWFDNPFTGKRELNGLRVMMALLNNWDLKADNNKIECKKRGECLYLVSDLGASFGKTGSKISHSKGNLKDYQESEFIKKATPEFVDFVLNSRPPLLFVFDIPYYREKAEIEKIAQHIPRADAAWIGGLLAQLSEDQVRDAFKAAGYEPDETEGYTKVVRERIAKLAALKD
jgi:hypothetical protein